MKVKFWKETGQLFIAIPCFSICCVGLIIAGIINSIIPLIVIGIIFLVVVLCFLFLPNYALTTIIFSNDGIEIKWFKKQLAFIFWNEITEVKSIPRGKGSVLAFYSNNKKIVVAPTKKIYTAIMNFCSNQSVINQIENATRLEWFRRK